MGGESEWKLYGSVSLSGDQYHHFERMALNYFDIFWIIMEIKPDELRRTMESGWVMDPGLTNNGFVFFF